MPLLSTSIYDHILHKKVTASHGQGHGVGTEMTGMCERGDAEGINEETGR